MRQQRWRKGGKDRTRQSHRLSLQMTMRRAGPVLPRQPGLSWQKFFVFCTCCEGSPWLKQGRPTSSDALSSESCRAPSGRDDSLFITLSRKDVNLQIGLLQQLGETVAGHKLGDQPEVQPRLVGHHPVVPLIITVCSKKVVRNRYRYRYRY